MEMRITLAGGKKVDVEYKGFTVRTDQPREAGGEGSAPSPFELFLASMGACAGFYVLSFCQERGLPTDGIRLTQRADKDPETKLVSRVSIALHLPPGFPEKYKTAVVKAAESCAVKKHLAKPPVIEVRTV
jgi:ribosomal protein S12 methylthiotransferase accessory factor